MFLRFPNLFLSSSFLPFLPFDFRLVFLLLLAQIFLHFLNRFFFSSSLSLYVSFSQLFLCPCNTLSISLVVHTQSSIYLSIYNYLLTQLLPISTYRPMFLQCTHDYLYLYLSIYNYSSNYVSIYRPMPFTRGQLESFYPHHQFKIQLTYSLPLVLGSVLFTVPLSLSPWRAVAS